MWIRSWFGLLSLLLLPIAIAALAYVVMNQRYAATMLRVPATLLSVLSGIADYVNGDACLRRSGLPRTKFRDLDPDLRCGHVTSG